jgi:hypothetical protein
MRIQANSVTCSPQTNYIDRATADCSAKLVPNLRIDGAWSAQRIPTAVYLEFLDR